MDKRLIALSEEYFQYLAYAYPVMSLSDEFYFMPRSNKAIYHLDYLDCLDKEKIKQDVSCIKTLKIRLENIYTENMELETQIDWQLLRQSISAYLWEFERIKIWRLDPNIYLKIIILGMDQILNKVCMIKDNIQEEFAYRIQQIPRLLNEAKVNLTDIPLFYRDTAISIIKSIIDYLRGQSYLITIKRLDSSTFARLIKESIHSLYDFKSFLEKRPVKDTFIKERELLRDLLIDVFSYKRDLAEIFEIASEEYQNTLDELKRMANAIQPPKTWQEVLIGYKLKVKTKKDLLNLYRKQIFNLKDFLIRYELITIPEVQDITVEETPSYLKPIRASASYSCPISKDRRETAFFYVAIDSNKNKKIQEIWENIHQEYIFITAHETYPGHHLLDSVRRGIRNPIRQQIESPFFYEGWASYAERIIRESGYINNTVQKMIGLRREAWRAIRAKLDIGIRLNKISLSGAAEELHRLGYAPRRIKIMLKHYLLTYGYQLCYTIGKFEIERLAERFISQLGIRNFHNCLIEAGEIPFELIQKRMERLCEGNSQDIIQSGI